ncbi:hypothetical protein DFR70_1322 [Nocardia tenerifensis]|uniref:Uncharacterized protein n=1 Tax=Nocardia tenerifensis TaxID=228006 RepID=A0A318JN35_9NOCA|nr:hypothetical protein DFR70_1322 [Nocardia tenerifensis]
MFGLDDRRPLPTATLDESGTLLRGNERRASHDVSWGCALQAAYRDVLVI